ncbi:MULTISPECIES: sugar transferase [Paenibacillus]|uniref:Sugar transferase n=1 Tax=Paenibacillus urinalis TaxID=521520 RepID=A0AAX3N612_9BACL|nr:MULTISPECIES: sugar transferase [Paenibacillus]WDH85037.1 sugar transferase [Paenibacillus urinalis]
MALESGVYEATLERTEANQTYLIMKRLTDMVASLLGLIVLSPLFLLLAVLIKLEDPKGPVFFKQQRVGKNERVFYMYKFRSMVHNAEELLEQLLSQNEVSGAMFKMKNDPRVTKIGRFIRKTSLDELPQLWNVVRGDMSLVGPRPPLPREVEEYSLYDKQRLHVTPGCTGLWQVSGRNSVGFKEMVEMDLQYIRNRKYWYDIGIILKTVKLLFGAKDAF